MAKVTLTGNTVSLVGDLPRVGLKAPEISLVKGNLEEVTFSAFAGKKIVLNIFPSLDTATCATTVRKFNAIASEMPNTTVLAISKDLPFAMERFCTTEGLKNVVSLSAFRNASFGRDYGVEILDGPLRGLFSRALLVVDENLQIIYSELVAEITEEPNYTEVLKILER